MKINNNHPFHLVDYRPWPFTGAIGVLTLITGIIKWFHNFNFNLIIIGYIITLLTAYQWWRDISREGTYQGKHTILVNKGLRWGIILFIISEIFFLLDFFELFSIEDYPQILKLEEYDPPQELHHLIHSKFPY